MSKVVVRKDIAPCDGINPRTGKRVGSRHRWPNGWGLGFCVYCDRTIEQVTRKYDKDGNEI